MKIRLLLVAICILSLPIFTSPSMGSKQRYSAPFTTVVLAGHVVATGVACSCNTAGCIEDYEGECGGHNTNQQSIPSDLGSGTLLILAALLLGLKLRA